MEKLIKDKVISDKSRVMYVNDGSKDNTWNMIKEIESKEEMFTGISLSRNRGHQNALVAGLLTAKELMTACGITEANTTTVGELDSCNYLMENTDYSTPNVINHGYWLETPVYSSTNFVWFVNGGSMSGSSSSYVNGYVCFSYLL